jgi:hypothetical protein
MIYIAGQITGLPQADAEAIFQNAENALRRLELKVINPLKLGIPYSWSYDDQISECKRVITKDATAIYLLRGWTKSKDAREEFEHVCKLNQLPTRQILIYYEEDGGIRDVQRDINDGVLTCLIPEE